MRAGRPRTLKLKKSFTRKRFGMARRGAANPKQKIAQRARHRRRKRG